MAGDDLEGREHEGEIPLGLDPEGCRGERVGLLPDLPGQEDAQDPDQDEDQRPAEDVLINEIGEEGDLLDRLVLEAERRAHAQELDEQDVEPDEDGGRQGKDGRVEPDEAGQGGLADGRPAQDERLERLPDKGQASGDVGPDPGREKGQFVPGQEIAAEAESQEEDKEEEPRDPGQLARLDGRP